MEGLERRYLSQYAKPKSVIDKKTLRAVDTTRAIVEDAAIRAASIKAQAQNAAVVFGTGCKALEMLRQFQLESGEKLFPILKAPEVDVQRSSSKQLSFSNEVIKFLCDMLIRSQEEYINSRDEATNLRNIITSAAEGRVSVELIGEMEEMHLEVDDNDSPITQSAKEMQLDDSEEEEEDESDLDAEDDDNDAEV